MFIQTERTPNPATLKFLPGRTVSAADTVDFPDAESAERSPLAKALFGLGDVTGVFFGADFVAVTKAEGSADWTELKPQILGIIMQHFTSGAPLLHEGAEEAALADADDPADEDIIIQIRELLESRIRPAVARDGGDIIYKNYYHIGVAVSTDKGLVVPVVREADRLSVAEIEAQVADFGRRARDGRLSIEEMQGGTFSITNGGVFGSLLSTPILNAPQSGILGMHRIEERPVVRDGAIVIRPMMYLALSYDHRIVDGKEAVTFLVRVKELLEDPQRLVLEL